MPANQLAGEEASLERRRGVTKLFVSGPAEKCEQLPFLGKVRTPVGKEPGLGLSFPTITTTAFIELGVTLAVDSAALGRLLGARH